MTIFLLASSLLIAFVVFVNGRQQKKRSSQMEEGFWARERRANSVRRKSLDGLPYITIPLESFPTHILSQDSVVSECIETIQDLTGQKIVNLTGFSNTDLKLEYGTANITPLSEYDSNYTILVRTLQKWADVLLQAGYQEEASILMKFAVSTGTDVSRTYYELASCFAAKKEWEQIRLLKQQAASIRSANGPIIRRHLEESYPDLGL